jgi:hypothetical protein
MNSNPAVLLWHMEIIAFQDGAMNKFPMRGSSLRRFSAGPEEALKSTFTFDRDNCVCLQLAFINVYVDQDSCAAGG